MFLVCSCFYEEDERKFTLYLPSKENDNSALIIALPGTSGSVYTFEIDTRLDGLACQKGYAVAYVEAITNKSNKTVQNIWNSGVGETGNDDIGYLKELAKYLQKEYNFDINKMYVCVFLAVALWRIA